jgi:hypothetical protein
MQIKCGARPDEASIAPIRAGESKPALDLAQDPPLLISQNRAMMRKALPAGLCATTDAQACKSFTSVHVPAWGSMAIRGNGFEATIANHGPRLRNSGSAGCSAEGCRYTDFDLQLSRHTIAPSIIIFASASFRVMVQSPARRQGDRITHALRRNSRRSNETMTPNLTADLGAFRLPTISEKLRAHLDEVAVLTMRRLVSSAPISSRLLPHYQYAVIASGIDRAAVSFETSSDAKFASACTRSKHCWLVSWSCSA